MLEQNYQHIIIRFLSYQITIDEFISEYMSRWKADREIDSFDDKFRRMINRLFTSCDCYSEDPSESFEISEQELRQEVELLSHVWWGLSSLNSSIKTAK